MNRLKVFIGITLFAILITVVFSGFMPSGRTNSAYTLMPAIFISLTPQGEVLTTDTPRSEGESEWDNDYAAMDRDDSGWWRSFRADNFKPIDEPLIKKTFGADLALNPDGYFIYESYYSASLGFATNLPALSVIEYGKTQSYGQTTPTADDYYYNHIHYLKNLEPNTAYNYRILTEANDGAQTVTENRTFTTKALNENVIRVPQDLTPEASGNALYKFDKADKTYLFTENLSSGDVFVNVTAANVTIDLGGYTLTYDDGEGEPKPADAGSGATGTGAYAILANGKWGGNDLYLYNGTIKQGKRGSSYANPVWTIHDSPETACVTFDYYGDDTVCWYNRDYFIETDKFHHNAIYDRGTFVTNRHMGIGVTQGGIFNDISWNSIRRFRHMGLRGGGKIHDNELYCDSYASNSFAISPGDNGETYNNKIFGVGYNPLGVGWAEGAYTHDNFIYLHATANRLRWREYNRISGVGGIRFSRTMGSSNTMNLENNVIICKVYSTGAIARGLWIGASEDGGGEGGTKVSNNTVKVETLIDDLYENTYSDNSVTCIDINGVASEHAQNTPQMLFLDNTLITNVRFISLGSSYGSGFNNVLFNRTRLEKIQTNSVNYLPLTIGYWVYDSNGSTMLNTVLSPGTDFPDTPFWYGSGAGKDDAGKTYGGECDLKVGNTKRIRFVDKNNSPVKNKTVTVKVSGEFTNYKKDGQELKPSDIPAKPFNTDYTVNVTTDKDGYGDIDFIETYHYSNTGRTGLAQRVDYNAVSFSTEGLIGGAVQKTFTELDAEPQVVLDIKIKSSLASVIVPISVIIAILLIAAALVVTDIKKEKRNTTKNKGIKPPLKKIPRKH